MIKVVALHDHVVELQKAQSLFHALFVAFGTQHIVHAEAGTHFAQNIHIVQLQQPIGIVYHDRLIFAKLNKTLHLLSEAITVVLDRFGGHHAAHIGAAAGVAHITGAAANQNHGPVSGHLQALHQAQSHKMAYMQAVGGRVKADIKNCLAVVYQVTNFFFIGHLSNQAAGNQFIINLHNFFPPEFAAENHKALCRIEKIRQRAINFAVPPLVCFILANKASRSVNFTLLRCNARTRQSLLFLSARCSGWYFSYAPQTSLHQPEALFTAQIASLLKTHHRIYGYPID